MKKIFFFTILAVIALLVSGCATISNMAVANSATISQANFKVVKPVSKSIEGTKILGFFGGGKMKVEIENAIEEMTKDLGPNQALAYINVVESSQVPIIPLIVKETCRVNAIVIEYEK